MTSSAGPGSVTPAVNQIQFSAVEYRRGLVEACRRHGTVAEAYSPLGTGRHLRNRRVTEIAARVGRTPAQVLLRWCLQHGVPIIPKSTHHERIAENGQVFDFTLSDEDMAVLDALDKTHGTDRALEHALIYALIQWVVVELLPDAVRSDRPLADVAQLIIGHNGAALVTIGALVSFYGYLSAKILATPRVKARAMQTWADSTPKNFSNCYAARDSLNRTHVRCFPIHRGCCVSSPTPKDCVIGSGGVRVPMRPLSGPPGLE